MKTFRFILVLSFLVLIGCERKNDQTSLAEENNIKEQHGRLCKTYEVFIEQLKNREADFLQKQKQYSWLSWNYADAWTKRYFDKKKTLASTR